MVTNTIYLQYEKMIYKAIHSSIKNSKIKNYDMEDLISEANLIFLTIASRYDESKNVKLSSYLYKSVYYGIFNYCNNKGEFTKSNKYKKHEIGIDPLILDFVVFNRVVDKINFEMLSMDAQNILNYILSREWEDLENKKIKKPSKLSISKRYNSKYGWTYSRINKAWNEIQSWWNKEGYANG